MLSSLQSTGSYTAVSAPDHHTGASPSPTGGQLPPVAKYQYKFDHVRQAHLSAPNVRLLPHYEPGRVDAPNDVFQPEPGHESPTAISPLQVFHTQLGEQSQPADLRFVDVHGPSGKVNAANNVRVRSHVMRNYHQKRRLHHIVQHQHPAARFISDPTGSTVTTLGDRSRRHVCEWRLADDGPASSKTASPNASPQLLEDTNPDPWADPWAILPERSYLECTSCGRLLFRSNVTPGQVKLSPILGGSHEVGSFDPFDSCAKVISHPMHELVHHCKPRVAH